MTRILLALLALMTGLAAQLGPAQARSCVAGTEVGAVAGHKASPARAVAAIEVCHPVQHTVTDSAHCVLPPMAQAATTPTVLIGIDRARE